MSINTSNPAEHLRDILIEPAPDLFFSRNDSSDPRMGDIVVRKLEAYVPEIRVGILGCPQDDGVRRNKGRTGAREAPTEIRRALYKLTPFSLETDISDIRIFDFGNIREGYTLEETHEHLEYAVEVLMENNVFPIVLGGGHDIAYPDWCGFAKSAHRVGAINIDAHLDYRKPIPERNSGTPFRQILNHESRKLHPQNFVEFGAQGFVNSAEYTRELQERGASIVSLEYLHKVGCANAFATALERASLGTERVYVSFDMDAVRSSDAPGVSATSPTGLSAEEMLRVAQMTGKHYAVEMIDVAETNPLFDHDGRTAKLAALVVMNFLAGFAQR
jgi:formimidoylglutamase